MSVIMPAHNEEAVIERALRGVLDGSDGQIEVVVVANGCRDATAGRALAAGPDILVIDLAQASKTAALNAGDEAATSFPRAYVDADVEVDGRTLLALGAALQRGPALVASPALRVNLEGANRWVRAYYAIWQLSAFRHSGHIGSGIYALSADGRARFGSFPPVIGDDRFVQGLFTPEERITLPDHYFTVRPPRTIAALVARGGRIAAGNRQLRDARLAGSVPSAGSSFRSLVSRVAGRPALWPAFFLYCTVQLRTRRDAAKRLVSTAELVWTRDETSRV